MTAVLIIGASSAIGKALTDHYLQQGHHVIWLSRSMPGFEHDQLIALQAPKYDDESGAEQSAEFFSSLRACLAHHQVNLMFNCIGWLHQLADGVATPLKPEKSISQSSVLLLRHTLQINLELPVFYLQGLWLYLCQTPAVKYLQLSARVGSIADNQTGGWYSYRSSKAALNQWIKTASIELQRSNNTATLVTVHPGTTDSHLSAPFQRNLPAGQLQSAVQTATRLADVASLIGARQSGLLFNWDGSVLPF